MAAADTHNAAPRSPDGAVFLHRADEVFAATRLKSAVPAQYGTYKPLIQPCQGDQYQAGQYKERLKQVMYDVAFHNTIISQVLHVGRF